MFTIISKTFDDYRIDGGFPTESSTQKNFLTGEKLNDRIVISVIDISGRGYFSYNFDVTSSIKLIERLENGREIEGEIETDGNMVFCVDDLNTTPNFLKTNLEEMVEKLNKIDYQQAFRNSFIIGKEALDIYDINTITSDTNAEEALVFGGIAIFKDLIDSDFDFYDYLTEPEKKNVGINSCGYCTNMSLSTSTNKIVFYNIDGTNSLSVCKDCAPIIRRRCAEFGDNQELIRKIVSEKI